MLPLQAFSVKNLPGILAKMFLFFQTYWYVLLIQTEANAIHQGNLNVLSVGVGSGVNQNELELIASDPSNVYTVSSFDALSNIEDSLKKTTCEGSCHFNQTGKNYKEGDHWKYGCNLNCLCVDGSTGTYTCEDA